MKLTLSAFGLVLALTAVVDAAPALRSEVMVNTPIVTVGDMFDDAGIFAEQGLFRAPAPGTTGIVSLEAVRQAAAMIGLIDFVADGVERVRVARDTALVDALLLTDLIEEDLRTRGILSAGMSAQARFNEASPLINAEAVAEPARLLNLRYMPGSSAFTARFIVAGYDQPYDFSGHIELLIEAPHLAANLPAGTILSATDLDMRPVPLAQAEASGFARLEDLVGKALQRQTRAGMLLRPADVSVPGLIARNDFVTIYFRSGPMTLTVKGQALGAAAEGETVAVLNLMSKKVLHGRAVGPGVVEVSPPISNVAGL